MKCCHCQCEVTLTDSPFGLASKENGILCPKADMHELAMGLIRTNYDNPPISIRSYDWSAWVDGSEEHGPIGRGKTEAEAVANLRQLVAERNA